MKKYIVLIALIGLVGCGDADVCYENPVVGDCIVGNIYNGYPVCSAPGLQDCVPCDCILVKDYEKE